MTKPLEALIDEMKAAAILSKNNKYGIDAVRFKAIASDDNVLVLIAALEQSQQLLNDGVIEEALTLRKRIAELEGYKTAYMEWSDKTDWVQKASAGRFGFTSLGMHLADVMTRHIEQLEASQLPVKLPPHKFSECVNELLEGAIAYAGTQQLRAQLSTRLSNFVKPDHPAGITVQGDE